MEFYELFHPHFQNLGKLRKKNKKMEKLSLRLPSGLSGKHSTGCYSQWDFRTCASVHLNGLCTFEVKITLFIFTVYMFFILKTLVNIISQMNFMN
jgi:hypothetical protein